MSCKRPLKRSMNITDGASSDYSPSLKSVQPKRSRIEEYSVPYQTKDKNHQESSVRRSSRAPKPKVFDDEFIDTVVRSPGSEREAPIKKDPKAVSRNLAERQSVDDVFVVDDHDTSIKRRSSRVPKPKIFDEDYVEIKKIKGIDEKNEKNMYSSGMKISQDAHKDTSQKPKIQNKGKNVNKNIVVALESDLDSDAKKPLSGAHKTNMTGNSIKHRKEKTIVKDDDVLAMRGNKVLETWGAPKVRTSSRTPVPKKTFSLIDDSPVSKAGGGSVEESDLYVDVITEGEGSQQLKPDKVINLIKSDSSPRSGEEIDITYTSPVTGKKKRTSRLKESGLDSERNTYIKQNKSTTLKNVVLGATSKKLEVNQLENITKEKTKKISKAVKKISEKVNVKKSNTKSTISDEGVDVVEVLPVKGKGKKKKMEGEEDVPLQQACNSVKYTQVLNVEKSSSLEHGGKNSKQLKLKHRDEPHSEVKDEDHHIILKVHLPHVEGSHHSHSAHKKHKHKLSSENKSETSSESKAKKQKLSHGSASSEFEDKHKKKLSIKFKGLSSSSPGIEFERAEHQFEKDKRKKIKEFDSVKKKSKKLSNDKPSTATGSDEKEPHVKVVIKKTKKEVKLITDGSEKCTKKMSKDEKEKEKEGKEVKGETSVSIKTTPKKKSKAVESPKSADKEKRKIVSGYLLFCKKERSRISEANPGLEFAQISQKVGEAWKNLPESVKEKWKAKANDVKKNFIIQQEDKKPESLKPGPDAVDMAAHLKLLGESLSVIGVSLMAQRETEVRGSLSVLLDSILCAICPLTFLTSHIPGISGISKEKQLQILDDLAYTMPGLG